MSLRMLKRALAALLLLLTLPVAAQQNFELRPPADTRDPDGAAIIRDLAQRMLPVYEEPDTARYLANLSVLQMAAGEFTAAQDTRRLLRERPQSAVGAPATDIPALFDLYTQAKASAATSKQSFNEAFSRGFREQVPRLGDRDAYRLTSWLRTPIQAYEATLRRVLQLARGKPSLDLPQAVELVTAYVSLEVRRSFGPWAEALADEDSRRRYASDEALAIRGAGGVTLYARVVRPKGGGKLPALLEVNVDGTPGEAEASAAHGYAGVVVYVRGQRAPGMAALRGGKPIEPFLHDGDDARAVIAWIARQPWSDGRVGMIGERYGGFAAWAAARRTPPALKAISTVNAIAPGIDFPLQGQIFRNDAYRWALDHEARRKPAADFGARWPALEQRWYRSGRPYPELPRVARQPSSIFGRWLMHPSYDRYWQKFIPFGRKFAGVSIPVLAFSGYYAEFAAGEYWYFREHLRQQPSAQHTLLIGPWGSDAMRPAPAAILRNYLLDTAALVDLRELRYQWFDTVFHNAPKPALLQDRVNYQLMGADRWRHASTLEIAGAEPLRFYLQPAAKAGEPQRLARTQPSGTADIRLQLRLRDRSDAVPPPAGDVFAATREMPRHALRFISEPLKDAAEFSGALAGLFDFTPNRMDVDLRIALYEQLASGESLQLCEPVEQRASYAGDRINRRLLQAGVRQQLAWRGEIFCGRQLQAGSRLVLDVGIVKRADRQLNYGSGKAVNDESMAEDGTPLRIQWHAGSYVELPVRR